MISDAQAEAVPLRLVAIGDVGHTEAYHVGDEAMLLGLIEGTAACGLNASWTVISADPANATVRPGVAAVPTFGFAECVEPSDREALLARLDAVLEAPPAQWATLAPERWRAVLAAIAQSDAAIIAGGGNLSRTWPEHVFERVAMVRAARRALRPVAITGQTIGPMLDQRTAELVREVLAACRLVGVREAHSYRLALALGAQPGRLSLQFDDSIGLQPVAPPRAADIVGPGPFIAVTLNAIAPPGHPTGAVARLAEQLAALAERTAATIVFVPHVGDLAGAPVHDTAWARAVVAAAGDVPALRVAPLPSPHEAVWYCRHAEMVVSSRYHPIVFAAAWGTPALFLHQDYYTQVKGDGAQALVGLQGWSLSAGRAALGLLLPAALELWGARAAVREHLQRLGPSWQQARLRHIGALLDALRPARTQPATPEPPVQPYGPPPRGDWLEQAHDGLAVLRRSDEDESTRRYVAALVAEVQRKEDDLVIAHSALRQMSARCEADQSSGPRGPRDDDAM